MKSGSRRLIAKGINCYSLMRSGVRSLGRGCWRGRGRGRRGRGSLGAPHQEGSSSGNRDKGHVKCFNCDKMGHYASECWSEKREGEVNLIQDEEPTLLLSIGQGETLKGEKKQDIVMLNEEEVFP